MRRQADQTAHKGTPCGGCLVWLPANPVPGIGGNPVPPFHAPGGHEAFLHDTHLDDESEGGQP